MMPVMSTAMMHWPLLALLLPGLIGVAVALVVTRRPADRTDRVDAEDELRARYARGEIGDDEYHNRLALLRALDHGRR